MFLYESVLFTFIGETDKNGTPIITVSLPVGDHKITDKTLTLVGIIASPDINVTIYSDEASPYNYPCQSKNVNECLFPKTINKISIHKSTLSKTPFYIILGFIGGLIIIGFISFAILKYMQKKKETSNNQSLAQ